jgi:hypothetical protein
MKKFFALPLAVVFVAACSDSSTAPSATANLSPSYAKPTPPPGGGGGPTNVLINDTFDFQSGIGVSGAGGSTMATQLQPGISGTSADPAGVSTSPSGAKFLGRFTETRTDAVLNVVNGYAKYTLTFDLYIIGSWDGIGKQAQHGAFDANVVSISANCGGGVNVPIFATTFSNQLTVQQDFPQPFGSGGGAKAASGSVSQETLGYRGHPELSNTPPFRSFSDAIYHLTYSGNNPCGSGNPIQFVWSTTNPRQQSMIDESWGVDNVNIKTGT